MTQIVSRCTRTLGKEEEEKMMAIPSSYYSRDRTETNESEENRMGRVDERNK